MIVQDITETFIDLVLRNKDQSGYRRSFPQLFDHYSRYWCPPGLPFVTLDPEEIRRRAVRVRIALDEAETALNKTGLATQDIRVVLFVGVNTSNGHAFLNDGETVVWLPVETYTSDMLARVFVMHEIAHGLQYNLTPDFDFHDELSKDNLGRQLITEGVATYCSALVLPCSEREALWADYLTEAQADSWFLECRQRARELGAYCRQHFNETIPTLGLFKLIRSDDITRFRAGYYVGLTLVRIIAARMALSVPDLLRLDREQFDQLALEELDAMR